MVLGCVVTQHSLLVLHTEGPHVHQFYHKQQPFQQPTHVIDALKAMFDARTEDKSYEAERLVAVVADKTVEDIEWKEVVDGLEKEAGVVLRYFGVVQEEGREAALMAVDRLCEVVRKQFVECVESLIVGKRDISEDVAEWREMLEMAMIKPVTFGQEEKENNLVHLNFQRAVCHTSKLVKIFDSSNEHVVIKLKITKAVSDKLNLMESFVAHLLRTAVEVGSVDGVKLVLDSFEKHADFPKVLNQQLFSKQSSSVFNTAQYQANLPIVKILLQKGGDPTLIAWKGKTVFQLACENGNIDVVKLLASHRKLNINFQSPRSKATALHGAAWRGNVDIVKFLLKQGAKTSLNNSYGETPLDVAKLKLKELQEDAPEKQVYLEVIKILEA